MNVRAYHASQGTVPLAQKLGEIKWSLAILIALIACAGFAVLYSAAGGSLAPWAERQIIRFMIGFLILIAVACVDLRVWMGLAYPAYVFSLLLLVAVEIAGRVGLGAQRWIELGPLQLQPSELMKIALAPAVSRSLHGLGPGQAPRPSALIVSPFLIAPPPGPGLSLPHIWGAR